MKTCISLLVSFVVASITPCDAFSSSQKQKPAFFVTPRSNSFSYSVDSIGKVSTRLFADSDTNAVDNDLPALKRVPADLEGVPIPFADKYQDSASGNSLKFIECYADSTCVINGVEYTIAVPCDYAVALCTVSDEDPDELIPIEVSDTEVMDELFPIAESIVTEEFGEELVLQRTPQTLTLVGELDEDDDDDGVEYDDDDEDEDAGDDEEEVDVLLSFEHNDKEYQLVRILDPLLLVGKMPESGDSELSMDMRVLLSPEESEAVMPMLEEMFMKFHNEDYDDEE